MISFTVSETAALLHAEYINGDAEFNRVSSDTRTLEGPALFVAIHGERFDGHDYVEAAAEKGAVAALVERELDIDLPQIICKNVIQSFGELATAWRDKSRAFVVALTGSNGKTTVKEMVAAILARRGSVLATRGNYNNELGLPLTLFRLQPEHRYAVLEMGAGKTGDIAYLADIAKPDVGLVNNIAPAHLEGFGSLEGVARTKGAMFASLPRDGWAVMNADEPWMDLWRGQCTADNVLTFGTSASADVRLESSADGSRIVTPNGSFEPRLALPGQHNLINATAATAIATVTPSPVTPIACSSSAPTTSRAT